MTEEYLEYGLQSNPLKSFEDWYSEAKSKVTGDPTSCVLSTVDENQRPSTRFVLLKEVTDQGFVFCTNYQSRKSEQLKKNPFLSLTFWWEETGKQIRIEGTAQKTSQEVSDQLFHSRPFLSQVASLTSHQSHSVGHRDEMEQNYLKNQELYRDKTVPRPDWGGFVIIPDRFEFFIFRESRFHDRFLYTLKGKDQWVVQRLWP